jgi:hypothetical protein
MWGVNWYETILGLIGIYIIISLLIKQSIVAIKERRFLKTAKTFVIVISTVILVSFIIQRLFFPK